MAERTLYLFDGYNLLHAGVFEDARQLRDALASFVALKGARGVVVFDGVGDLEGKGPLEVQYATHADALLERLAADHRSTAEVILVSSDAAVRGTSGMRVQKISSQTFLADLEPALGPGNPPSDLRDRLDPETLARLERLRRGGR